jgi:hypothetical protein
MLLGIILVDSRHAFERLGLLGPWSTRVVCSLFFFLAVTPWSASADTIFQDDFNRPDSSSVGNGWLDTSGNVNGNLGITNNAVSPSVAGGEAGIYRSFSGSAALTATATLGQENGFGGLLRRYGAMLTFFNDGIIEHGYGLEFSRGDQNFSDSRVTLLDGGTEHNVLSSSFQYGPKIDVSFTMLPDGTINGSVANTGGGSHFEFSFGPHLIQSSGSNFMYSTGFADNRSSSITHPSMDDLTLTAAGEPATTVPLPKPWVATLAFFGGVLLLRPRRQIALTLGTTSERSGR